MVGRKADVDVMPVAQLQLLGYSSHEIQSSGVAAAGVSFVIISAPFFFFFFFFDPRGTSLQRQWRGRCPKMSLCAPKT